MPHIRCLLSIKAGLSHDFLHDGSSMSAWPLRWSHGHGWVEAVGAMLGPVYFGMPDGSEVQPFAIFPWAQEPLPSGQEALAGLMARGRGEWPCVPFGICSAAEGLDWTHPIHGESAHGLWERIDDGLDLSQMRLRYDCPADGPIESLERHIRGVPDQPVIECRLLVRVRSACRLPIGLHPTLRLPQKAGTFELVPGSFEFGHTFPTEVEPGADIVAADQLFSNLAAVPRRGGGVIDLTSLPLTNKTESLVQLCAINGHFQAINKAEGYAFHLTWDPQQLPSCLLWISQGGRTAWPWSGRHYALGVEPVCSAFDLGVVASTGHNAISQRGVATSITIEPSKPLDLSYRMAVYQAPVNVRKSINQA